MLPALLPEPKSVEYQDGYFALPSVVQIAIESRKLTAVAAEAAGSFKRAKINISVPSCPATLTLATAKKLPKDGYTLTISETGITIKGDSPTAVRYGIQTLAQIVDQCGSSLPCLTIKDWPDFQYRGIYYDVCRGRVPTLDNLMTLADQLAKYKINQLQLYVEHTFAFRGHPDIGRGASPLSADDILQLDDYCAERGIELLPSLATFGHLATVLHLKQYRHLAEDLAVGEYQAPKDEMPAGFKQTAWTLSPAVPEIYDFLDSLFAEFLPLFRSKRFNICCDETWDLGLGQSYKLCQKKGKGIVYLDHIKKVRKICKKYNKKILFWGDIIRHYPELISKIPDDATVLDWGYGHNHPFKAIKDFKKVGLPFYACPGTSSWRSLFPRIPEAEANIRGFAAAGAKNKARGLLTTDWGDGGHHNFMEFSWHGYLLGAEMGWNSKASSDDYTERFFRCFLKTDKAELIEAFKELGRISYLQGPAYQSIWYHLFFAAPKDPLFGHKDAIDLTEIVDDQITPVSKPLDADLASAYLPRIQAVQKTLSAFAKKKSIDHQGVLPYWVFAADTLACAVRKLHVLGPGGDNTPASRQSLAMEMQGLMTRFEKLWMARNRRSEIRITLKKYKQAIAKLST